MLRICSLFILLMLPLVALADPSGVVRVIDGDTWNVGGARVRLFGIDTPETDQTCERGGELWRCGAWASREVRARYQGKTATCRAVTVDRYQRIVARCSVEGRDVGRDLVADGVALAYRRYSMDYDLDEKRAAVQGTGLHGADMQRPSDFRAAQRQVNVQPAPGDCRIKGNVSSKGERIYHVPGQEHYNRTKISPAKGERWFCSESEARAAGWRRAKR